MTDQQHMNQQFQPGNRAAFEAVFNDCWEPVYLAALKRVGDEDIAKEITQELFIYLWEKREQLEIRGAVLPYLLTAVKFRVINHFKSAITRRKYHDDLLLLMDPQSADQTDSSLQLKDIETALEDTLTQMPERMRLIFSMNRLEQKTIAEIAAELDLSGQTVKNQLGAALKIVRKHFSFPIIFLLLIIS